jgi:hypothetical protein
MSERMAQVLEAFETLPPEEKRALAVEILRRALPFDSGPIEDDEIGRASADLFRDLDGDNDATAPRCG